MILIKLAFTGIFVLLVFIIPAAPITAQNGLSPCSPAELESIALWLNESYTAYEAIVEASESQSPSQEIETVLQLDEFNRKFWLDYIDHADQITCTENFILANTFGSLLDDTLISAELSVIGQYEPEFTDAELTANRHTALEENRIVYEEMLTAALAGEDFASINLPPCSAEFYQYTLDLLAEPVAGYYQFGEISEPLQQIIAYANLSKGYWSQIHPKIPMCIDAQDLGVNIGHIIDTGMIIVGLQQLAEFQTESNGYAQAGSLLESAAARTELLKADTEFYLAGIK